MRRLPGIVCAVLAGLTFSVRAADQPVWLSHDQPWMDVLHEGRIVRIQRNPDNLNDIEPDYALTSRPCPPYCIQPMQLAPGVETLGELELFEILKRIGRRDESLLLIDSRDRDWLVRSGIIPTAIHLPWTWLHPAHSDLDEVAALMELTFGAARNGPFWNFEHAKALVFYCNGPWCGQSSTNIKQLLALGYPPHKLKWYRGGMQAWKSLGLTTVPVAAQDGKPSKR